MTYHLVISKRASKAMEKLPKIIRKRVDAAILMLRKDPFIGKKLEGDFVGAWTVRVWPYRIIYSIHQEMVTVIILRVGHRQGIYN